MDTANPDLLTMEAFQATLSGLNNQSSAYPVNDIGHMSTNGSTSGNGLANGTNGTNGTLGPGSFPSQMEGDTSDDDANNHIDTLDEDDETALPGSISFMFANEKRFSDFHALFRSVPDEEKLIEDYGCALQKEILVQGRLFISENHVCFNANIFGWVTNLVIAFSEITAIEKRLTAFVIPNAISIVTTTNTKGHFFASFLSRDAAHDLLMAAWRKSFPCAANASVTSNNNMYIKQNRSNVTLNGDEDDAQSFMSARAASESRRNRHRRSSSASQNWTADEADWDEDDDMPAKPISNGSNRRPVIKKLNSKKSLKDGISATMPAENGRSGRGRSMSELPSRPTSLDGAVETVTGHKSTRSAELAGSGTRSRAGTGSLPTSRTNGFDHEPTSSASNHAPTTCKCSKDGRHYANSFMSETYPGTVQAMWELLFDSEFSKKFLTNEAMKGADVQEEPWKKGADGLTKITKYTKWLGMPIGPKTTKAILTDVCENKDFDNYVTAVTTTSTPDVPSGGSFTTKCRTCITWAGPNQVLVVVTGAVEFTKSSWIKGQIEKGAADGMGTHFKELNKSIRKHIAAHPADFAVESEPPASGAASPVPLESVKQPVEDYMPPTSNGYIHKLEAERSSPSVNEKESGAVGFWSMIQDALSGGAGSTESLSHLALVCVLLLVLLANIYIWFQINSVTTQIERIQGDILYRRTGEYHEPGFNKARAAQRYTEDVFTRDQEEAMWAWLTEREAKNRRYQQKQQQKQKQKQRAYDWDRVRKQDSDTNDDNNDNDYPVQQQQQQPQQKRADSFQELSEAEIKLQQRINELQQQLEVLERALPQ
ncbi:hypothetical protein BG005_011200 [Podila minutissima]|nr:hypothetical protein BG005_011200 [Podila minutissima]